MTITILSDTHGLLDERLIDLIHDSDEIWHGGDVGNFDIIERLEQLPGKLRGVYGNIDDQNIRLVFPEYQVFELNGCRVLMLHIAGNPPNYNPLTRKLIKKHAPNLLVCGHSHILKVKNDKVNNLLFINPGACGHHGFHRERTIIQFEINNGKPANMKVINLGKRGRIGK